MTKPLAKNEKKGNNKKLVLVIAIAMLLVATVGATFAYFASRTEINNTLNIVTNIENNNGSFITTATNIELNVTSASMQESVSNTIAASNTGVLNVEYLSGSENGITCKYDINYEWVSDNNENPYTITNILKDEFTYEITDGSNTIISERNFVASSNRNKQKLGTGYIYNADTETPTVKQYNINAKFYNLEENQSNNANKNWNIKFYVDNVVCGVYVESTYTLSGVLLDDNNNPVPNATIVTFSEPRYTKTDASGAFTISGLENEEHNIYYVPNNSIVGLIDLSKNDIAGLMNTKSGIFDTSNELNEIPLTNNYKIQINELSEVPISSGNNGGNNNGGSSSGTEGTLLTTLKSEAGTNETNDFGNWAIINQEVTVSDETVAAYNLSSNTYVNTIYIGRNPDNFIEFNGELWRIIGIYNEDTHGMSGQQLVKIIKNDNIRSESATQGTIFDKKTCTVGGNTYTNTQNMVGSSTNNQGSNDWSDSQLMFMLNGPEAINKGKLYDGSPMTTYTTSVDGNYIVDKNGYKIMRIDKGNYLSTDENGNSITNKEVYIPEQATTSSLTETTGILAKTLSSESQNMIQEVDWRIGTESYDASVSEVMSDCYEGERSTNACTEYSNCQFKGGCYGCETGTSSIIRPTLWTGKVGLSYLSDYLYATNGSMYENGIDRASCLNTRLYEWVGKDASGITCRDSSWLNFIATSSSSLTSLRQWTFDPGINAANGTRHWVPGAAILPNSYNSSFYISNSYYAFNSEPTNNSYGVRPVVYLKSNVNITSGDGSYNNPYELSM